MQTADTVHLLRKPHCKIGHREFFSTVMNILSPEIHDLIPREIQNARIMRKVTAQEFFAERIMSCPYRCVCCEKGACPDDLNRFRIREMLFLHVFPDTRQAGKGGMSFVEMINIRLHIQRIEHSHPADAEQ